MLPGHHVCVFECTIASYVTTGRQSSLSKTRTPYLLLFTITPAVQAKEGRHSFRQYPYEGNSLRNQDEQEEVCMIYPSFLRYLVLLHPATPHTQSSPHPTFTYRQVLFLHVTFFFFFFSTILTVFLFLLSGGNHKVSNSSSYCQIPTFLFLYRLRCL